MWSNIRLLQSLPARSTIQQRHSNTKSLLSYSVIYVLWNDISFYVKKLIWAKLNELLVFIIIARNRYTSALLVKVTNRLTSGYCFSPVLAFRILHVKSPVRIGSAPSIASTLIFVIVAVPDDGPCTVISSTVTKLWNCKSMN